MKYTVRSPDGELSFQSFGELEHAFWSGLVDPEDEVREEGAEKWRRADSFAVLRRPKPLTSHDRQAQRFWLFLAVVLGSIALWAFQAHQLAPFARYGVALVAAALLAAVLGKLTRSASARPTRKR